ncbi:hydantoinase/oxoprolinase family protein [Microbacterium sp. A204]|uniref:hydantoinase/oxoprolinase family protein n=1 Tax=Microbacterium sp. A204 TaxID=3457321 RepID=UPI003FD320AB
MTHVVAVDIGGTHTDSVLLRSDGALFISKVKSTPQDPGLAMMTALDGLIDQSGVEIEDIGTLVHGTTVVTNAVILGSYARVGLIVTEGFEDILEIGTQQRSDLYDPWRPKTKPLVSRGLVMGCGGRISSEGLIIDDLDEEAIRAAAQMFRGNVDAVAVAFLFSFANPAHEKRVAEILSENLPGVPVSLSCEVAPEFREYPRTSTTVLNAALLPHAGGYIQRLDRRLNDRGFRGAFQLMTSTGGVIPAKSAMKFPVTLLVSGPAGAAVAAAEIGTRIGHTDLVMLDVGGTSSDIALITPAGPKRRYRGEVAGMPVALPQIDVIPIGAGGGSIARVDEFGSLSVGPESVGADPGPAAYGTGKRPALTDAHLVRGSLDSAGLLGGALPLDVENARLAIDTEVAAALTLTPEQAAVASIRIANGKMADTIRAVTFAQGIDIRALSLMAFGGAGPLHACELAEELGVDCVIVPRYPGLTSALGLLMGEGRYEVSRTYIAPLETMDAGELRPILDVMAADASAQLRGTDYEMVLTTHLDVDMRYQGQAYELTIPAREGIALSADSRNELEASFVAAHQAAFGHSWNDEPIELVTLRVRAISGRSGIGWSGDSRTVHESVPPRTRLGTDQFGKPTAYAVLAREDVQAGLHGPALIEQTDATTLLPEGWHVERNHGLAMIIRRSS